MLNRCAIWRGLKIPRCGLISGMLAAELEPAREIGGIKHATSEDREPIHVAECGLA